MSTEEPAIIANFEFVTQDPTEATFTISPNIQDLNYVYRQDVAQKVWTITHNLNKFPSVKSSIESVQQVYNALTTAKDNLKSLEDSLESAEKFLAKMKDAYDMFLQIPGAYVGSGAGKVAINPMPSITIGYAAIVQAQKAVDKAQDLVNKAQSKVDSISNKLEEAKKAVVKKIISLKV